MTLYKPQTIIGTITKSTVCSGIDRKITSIHYTYDGMYTIGDNTNAKLYTLLTDTGKQIKALSMDGMQYFEVTKEEVTNAIHNVYMQAVYIAPSVRHSIH